MEDFKEMTATMEQKYRITSLTKSYSGVPGGTSSRDAVKEGAIGDVYYDEARQTFRWINADGTLAETGRASGAHTDSRNGKPYMFTFYGVVENIEGERGLNLHLSFHCDPEPAR